MGAGSTPGQAAMKQTRKLGSELIEGDVIVGTEHRYEVRIVNGITPVLVEPSHECVYVGCPTRSKILPDIYYDVLVLPRSRRERVVVGLLVASKDFDADLTYADIRPIVAAIEAELDADD